MLDLKKLQTFKVTVDKGSFSAAAEKLNYSPSTVSKHIAELKEEIGEPLIKEDTLSKGLTEVGMLTYNY
ncbi:MAG: LysR family transcriptional regulator, partial [Staphylococcus equorum]|nr:LysR family transcriptional regulator [Staphylococcus equorum]